MSKTQILVAGDLNGQFDYVFKKVEKLKERHNEIELLICCGNFFGGSNSEWSKYKEGKARVPVDTYVLGPTTNENMKYFTNLQDGMLAPNIYYLGKTGVFNSSSGLKIAYVSGLEEKTDKLDLSLFIKRSDILKLKESCLSNQKNYRGIDLLVTSAWPHSIHLLDNDKITVKSPSKLISWLAMEIMPRYIISAYENVYYERKPYKNLVGQEIINCSRFIGLGAVKSTEKWMYGFKLTPIQQMKDSELSADVSISTDSPLLTDEIINLFADKSNFFFATGQKRKSGGNFQNRRMPKARKLEDPSQNCWFCLCSPKAEKHLIVSIGEEVYLTLAKGALSPDHFLLASIGHTASLSQASDQVRDEVLQYKRAIKAYYASKNSVPVFFERHYKSYHLQLNAVPVPKSKAESIKLLFQKQAGKIGFTLEEYPKNSFVQYECSPESAYFHAELPTGEELMHEIKTMFPLQFGREALVADPGLKLEGTADWRECTKSVEEETKDTNDLKAAFKPFDFTVT